MHLLFQVRELLEAVVLVLEAAEEVLQWQEMAGELHREQVVEAAR